MNDSDLTDDAGSLYIGIALLILNVVLIMIIVLGARESVKRASFAIKQVSKRVERVSSRTAAFVRQVSRSKEEFEMREIFPASSATPSRDSIGVEIRDNPMLELKLSDDDLDRQPQQEISSFVESPPSAHPSAEDRTVPSFVESPPSAYPSAEDSTRSSFVESPPSAHPSAEDMAGSLRDV